MGGIGSGRKWPEPKPLNREDLRNIRRLNRDSEDLFRLKQISMIQRLQLLGYSGREIGELLGYSRSWAQTLLSREGR